MPFNQVGHSDKTFSDNTLSVEASAISIKPEFKVADSISIPNSGIMALCTCGNQTITRQEAMSDREDEEAFVMKDLIPIDPAVEIHFIHQSKEMNVVDLQKLHKQIYRFMDFHKIYPSDQDIDVTKVINLTNKEQGLFAYASVYAYIVKQTYQYQDNNADLKAFYDNPFVAQSVCFAIMSTYNGFNSSKLKQDMEQLEFLQSRFNNFKEQLFNTNGFHVYDAAEARTSHSTFQSGSMTGTITITILSKKPIRFITNNGSIINL